MSPDFAGNSLPKTPEPGRIVVIDDSNRQRDTIWEMSAWIGVLQMAKCHTVAILSISLPLVFAFCLQETEGGEVAAVSVWLNQNYEAGPSSYYAGFYSDVWGTVDQFKSITLTSPLGNTYPLSLDDDGDQWGSAQEGTIGDIRAEFTDGVYVFHVVYTDNSVQTETVLLGGVFPEYPQNVLFDGNLVTWDPWGSPVFPIWIEVAVGERDGEGDGRWGVSYTATTLPIPNGLVENDKIYDLSVYFVSSEHSDGYKASITTIVIPEPGTLSLLALGAAIQTWFSRGKRFKG
jgi:hypothetical protein